MLALEVTINVFVIVAIFAVAMAAGFMMRASQISGYKRKVVELEKEMLNNHATILDLQHDIAKLEKTLIESKIPVIPMKKTKDEEAKEGKKIGM
jgi:wobble nucleotide-excising tRNase